ncbi:uncharacterized protein LOC131936468 [Physella acuta]|uniref:uncharacterized protein LOC131936468 n=1 Tax=Physella acuta TaxID=109671 RepID=UPI0027DD031C|nr:uncharacterized protein LOC131936468 [Physella acuta]
MAPFLHLGCWWGAVLKLICLFTCLTAPSVHGKLQLKDVNQTDTSVTITWTTPQEILKEIDKFRLVISQERDGFSTNYIYALHDDPECSLRLSSCVLGNLRPNTPYKVKITIHLNNNSTWMLSGERMINTLPARHAHAHIDMEWWLTFVAAPLIVGCLLFLGAAVLCCRIWHCCCWRRGTTHTDHQIAENSSSASSDKFRRSESHATRQWVNDTFRAIDPDPPSTYDRPVVDYNSSYELSHNSSSTTVIGLTRELQSSFKMKGKTKTSTGIGKPAPSVQPPPVPSTEPLSTPTHYLNTTAALKHPESASQNLYENRHIVSPKQLPSGSRIPQEQKVSSAALYTNTEDLDKLLGNSRKMFTML